MSTNDNEDVGAAIWSCVREMGKLCEDVDAMLQAADRAMAAQRWHALTGKVDSDNDRRIGGGASWWPRVVGRGYATELSKPKDKATPVESFRFLEVHLAPQFATAPMIVFGSVQLKNALASPWKMAWRDWVGSSLEDLPETQPHELDEKQRDLVVPNARKITLHALPLLAVNNDASLIQHVVDPLQRL